MPTSFACKGKKGKQLKIVGQSFVLNYIDFLLLKKNTKIYYLILKLEDFILIKTKINGYIRIANIKID